MSIQIDNRAGSADLAPLLRGLQVQVSLTRLEFGDIAWLGLAQNGAPVNVGVEFKSLNDILACIVSGRFAGHQLPGMLRCYDDIYLLVYGEWRRRATDGVLEQRRDGRHGGQYWAEAGGGQRRWLWRDLESWFMTMQIMGSLRVIRVPSPEDAAHWLKMAYGWYQREEHKSHLVMYSSKELYADQAMLIKPPLVRRVAAELPHIGLKRSAAVAARFKSVLEMAEAPEQVWMNLMVDDNKRLGTRGATVYRSIRGAERWAK